MNSHTLGEGRWRVFLRNPKKSPLVSSKGKPMIHFVEGELNNMVVDLKYVLVGKFYHGVPKMHNIYREFNNFKKKRSAYRHNID